jgi:membrane-bound lytic murein transglycosylase A
MLVATLAELSAAFARQKPFKLPNAQMVPATFAELEGWSDDDHTEAFGAFLKNCKAILHSTKVMMVKSSMRAAVTRQSPQRLLASLCKNRIDENGGESYPAKTD